MNSEYLMNGNGKNTAFIFQTTEHALNLLAPLMSI